MSSAATYETLVSGHLLEIRDVRRRPAAAQAWDTTPRPALVTGIESGPVRVEVGLLRAPFDVDGEGWDEAAEVSVLAGPRGVVVVLASILAAGGICVALLGRLLGAPAQLPEREADRV